MIQPPVTEDEDPLSPAQVQVLSKWGILDGFEIVDKPPHPRLIASVYGTDKTGKTSLALTFPAPLVFMNFDYGLDELIYTRPELVGNLFKYGFEIDETMIARDLEPILDDFETKYAKAVAFAGEHGGTVVIDTASQLWQIVQDVKVAQVQDERMEHAEARIKAQNLTGSKASDARDRASKTSQLDYGRANMYMAALLRRVFHHPRLNACFLHKAKPEYSDKGQKIEGSWEFNGFGETSGITQVHLYTYKEHRQHKARIMRCRFDSSLDGLDILNPTHELIQGMMGML